MIKTRPDIAKDGLYSIPDMAKILGVCNQTAYKYVKTGLITAYVRKMNNSQVVKGKDIIRLWESLL